MSFWTPSAAEEKYIRGGMWREELQDTPLLAETEDGGSGKKQEYISESREPTPPIWKGLLMSVLVLVTGQNSLVKGTWYLPERKSVLYPMANIQKRGRSYTLSITAASIKAN